MQFKRCIAHGTITNEEITSTRVCEKRNGLLNGYVIGDISKMEFLGDRKAIDLRERFLEVGDVGELERIGVLSVPRSSMETNEPT